MNTADPPSDRPSWFRRRSTALSLLVLAALAYVPSLASAPGRMPADTKLYLYLEPADLLGRAASTFEREQFAGWVPHQQITYLWPSGPWYRLFDLLGTPDWIAHRLWIGTILFAAGAGVRWSGRKLGLTPGAAIVAALVYQLSPYVLPYISRTSLMLLPWAALGWIVGLTVLACRVERREADSGDVSAWRRWRYPAAIALVVATVGSVNAAALAFIAPGPVLWLVHAAWTRTIAWRRALMIAVRVAVLCIVVSLWWMAMLVVQSRSGAPVLSYSETLEDVSRNATGSEVLRGLGYWLFYVRDVVAPTTTASTDYLVSIRGIAISYGVVIVGLIGLVAVRWSARGFAALSTVVGAVLAVGVHPLDSPSPLMSVIADDDGSGLALALRSSTRATPLFVLGIALGAGALVGALPERRLARGGRTWSPRLAAGISVAVLAIVNLPALWGLDLVDPAIDRDEDPPDAWVEAAAALDRSGVAPDGGVQRVLQLPGAEFGAFRWGYTVDQPLVALTERPLVTRDLLPLGSAATMDLLYALDDRVQEGTLEPGSLVVGARLLGVDTIWLANDLQFERFRTPRPERFAAMIAGWSDAGDLGALRTFGAPAVNTPDVAMLDAAALADPSIGSPLAPVALVAVDDPLGVIRAKTDSVLLSGNGDGLLDAAAGGLLTGGEAIRYSATLDGSDLDAAADGAVAVVITDTNRDRARHWRGSQDVHGHTEPGGPETDVLTRTNADQRLAVFEGSDADRQSIAIQEGPVTAIASSYGEPFAYRPEDRAVMAIDGDPETAWLVGDHGDPVGERIRLDVTGTTEAVSLRQPMPAPDGPTITRAAVRVDDGARVEAILTEESRTANGQRVELPTPVTDGSITIEILEVGGGGATTAAGRAGVGFVEIDTGLGATVEYVRPPVDAVQASTGNPLAIVLTRLRTDPLDPWRDDPEPELQRLVELSDERAMQVAVTLGLDLRAPDEVLAGLFSPPDGSALTVASSRLTGSPRHAGMFATDGDPMTAWISPFDGALGATLAVPIAGAGSAVAGAGRFDLVQPAGPYSVITELEVTDDTGTSSVSVGPPDQTGRSVVELGAGPVGDTLVLTVTGIEPATSIDRRYGDVTTHPVAVAEMEAPWIVPVPIDGSAEVESDCRSDLVTIDDEPLPLRYRTTIADLLGGAAVAAEPCTDFLRIDEGAHRLRSHTRGSGLSVDRVVLSDPADVLPSGEAALVPVAVSRDDARNRTVTVEPCPSGCWLVLGEGYNDAWEATTEDGSLGPPQLVDAGFNGWWLPAGDRPTTVELEWTAQRAVTVGLAVSLLGIAACIAIVVVGRRRPGESVPVAGEPPRLLPAGRSAGARAWQTPLLLLLLGGLLIAPEWGAAAAVIGLVAGRLDRRWSVAGSVLGWAGVVSAALVAIAVLWIEWSDRPIPNAGWTESFDHLNGAALMAVLLVAVGALRRPGPGPVPSHR